MSTSLLENNNLPGWSHDVKPPTTGLPLNGDMLDVESLRDLNLRYSLQTGAVDSDKTLHRQRPNFNENNNNRSPPKGRFPLVSSDSHLGQSVVSSYNQEGSSVNTLDQEQNMCLSQGNIRQMGSPTESVGGSANGVGGSSECVVCGDKSSGKHYGQYTCEGCKSFFKRSVRRDLNYSCRSSRSCPVDMQHRNQCQYCRFQKCIKVGMRKEAVQRGRIPMGNLTGYLGIQSYGGSSTFNSWSDSNSQGLTPSHINSGGGGGGVYHLSTFLSGVMKAEHGVPILAAENMADQACQILIATVEWARRLPHFQDLHPTDHFSLLSNSWQQLFLVNFLQCGLANSLTSLVASSGMFLDPVQLRVIQDQLDRITKLNPDPVELACMKALILFDPDSPGLSETSTVDSIQERIQCALEDHVKLSYSGHISRFGRLLLRLPTLRCLPSHLIEQVFFLRLSGTGKVSVDTAIRDILLGCTTSPLSVSHQFPSSGQHQAQMSPLTVPSSQLHHHHSVMSQNPWSQHYSLPHGQMSSAHHSNTL